MAPYIKYLEESELPTDESAARRLVLESKVFEMIDGVLHHESPTVPGRWCVVVLPELRSELLTEAHDDIFAGHFSSLKYTTSYAVSTGGPRCEQKSESSVGAVSVVPHGKV